MGTVGTGGVWRRTNLFQRKSSRRSQKERKKNGQTKQMKRKKNRRVKWGGGPRGRRLPFDYFLSWSENMNRRSLALFTLLIPVRPWSWQLFLVWKISSGVPDPEMKAAQRSPGWEPAGRKTEGCHSASLFVMGPLIPNACLMGLATAGQGTSGTEGGSVEVFLLSPGAMPGR